MKQMRHTLEVDTLRLVGFFSGGRFPASREVTPVATSTVPKLLDHVMNPPAVKPRKAKKAGKPAKAKKP